MKTATFIRQCKNFRGDARLYKLSEPVMYAYYKYGDLPKTNYIIISAVEVNGIPETYIFPANEEGTIVAWDELEGSFRGELNHEKALKNLGFELR